MVNWLDKLYLGVTAKRGKNHDCLGMTFDFSKPREVKVSMYDYIDKVLTGFPEEILETAPSPVGDHLFKFVMERKRRYSQRSREIRTTMFLHSFCFQHSMYNETFRLLSHFLQPV